MRTWSMLEVGAVEERHDRVTAFTTSANARARGKWDHVCVRSGELLAGAKCNAHSAHAHYQGNGVERSTGPVAPA